MRQRAAVRHSLLLGFFGGTGMCGQAVQRPTVLLPDLMEGILSHHQPISCDIPQNSLMGYWTAFYAGCF